MLNTLKDWSVVYAFDRSGYLRHARNFEVLDDQRFADKHYLITGGTSGIGAALAGRLMEAGAHVTVTGRDASKFKASRLAENGANFLQLDMADFTQLRNTPLPKVDGLVCNAGGMPNQLTLVDSRYDLIFASQVIGHYLLIKRHLTEGLLPRGAPVHITSSGGMYLVKLRLDDLCWQRRRYDKVKSYANAKRAQVILNQELAKQFPQQHFSCSHPGWVGTQALAEAMPDFVAKLGHRLRTAEEGADTIYWCLNQHAKIATGEFWFDREARWIYPFFWTREKKSLRQALLHLCEEAWARYD